MRVLGPALLLATTYGWELFESFAQERIQCRSSSLGYVRCVEALWVRCLANMSTTAPRSTCWSSCNRSRSDDSVWVTLVNGNAVNYTAMAMVQALSVRLFSCYQHVTLVTPEVGVEVRTLLHAVGSEVRDAQHIYWPRQPKGVIEGYRWLFSKLNLWRPGVVGHARAIFIDADTFLTDPGADRLVERECLSGSADFCGGIDYSANLIQGGILVARPSATRYDSLMSALSQFGGGPNAFVPDMDFLTHYFGLPDIMKAKPKSSRRALLRGVGLQLFNLDNRTYRRKPTTFDPCPSVSRYSGFGKAFLMKNKTRHVIARFSLWHHCGAFKLDRIPPCEPPRTSHSDVLSFKELPHPFCDYRVMQLYQWLQRRANPCSTYGASRADCARASTCRWCSQVVRCIPLERSCQLSDAAAVALKARSGSRVDLDSHRTGWCSLRCDPACCVKQRAKRPALAKLAQQVLAGTLSDGGPDASAPRQM